MRRLDDHHDQGHDQGHDHDLDHDEDEDEDENGVGNVEQVEKALNIRKSWES